MNLLIAKMPPPPLKSGLLPTNCKYFLQRSVPQPNHIHLAVKGNHSFFPFGFHTGVSFNLFKITKYRKKFPVYGTMKTYGRVEVTLRAILISAPNRCNTTDAGRVPGTHYIGTSWAYRELNPGRRTRKASHFTELLNLYYAKAHFRKKK
jgi:hypothetical protein